MASKFSRSGVFASSVDYFCLVCECRLRDERDAYAHVTKPVHIKNFDVTEYFEKNIEDRVRKIKKWYFCEFCNHLLSTAARVRLHVMEPQHLENKNTTFLERYGSLIVAFGKVLIDDKAWNGIIDDMCAICNTEFEDENIHKNETAHIIKLIQNKVEFDAEKNLFRKIDNSSFQCLTCNMVIALNEMSLHFDLTKHKTLYQKNFDFTKITEPKKIDVLSIKTENSETQNKTKITENDNAKNTTKLDDSQCLDKGRRNQQDVVKKTENKIHGNISKRSVNKVNDDTINKPTLINDAKICEILGAKNYITTDENKKVWCILCNWCMNPMEIHSHINDQHHQTILKLHRERIKKLNSNETYTLTKHTIVDDNSKIVENPPSKGNILDFIETFQKSHININLEFQIATCKKCSKCLDYNVQSIVNHIEEHTKIIEQKDVSKPSPLPSGLEATKIEDVLAKKNSLYTTPVLMKTSSENGLKNYDAQVSKSQQPFTDTEKEVETFVKENNMKYVNDKTKVYCNSCNTYIPLSLRSLKEHVSGLTHKSKANQPDVQIVQAEPKPKSSEKK